MGIIPFLLTCSLLLHGALSAEKIRGVNLGGWLVIEEWMTPYLFDGIPNGDMLDGRQVQFKSVPLRKYIVAENGGGSDVNVDRDSASGWETFKLWRVSETKFQFRSFSGNFLSCAGDGCRVSAMAKSPSATETFEIIRNGNGRVHIKLSYGPYVQATSSNQLTANYPGMPGWDDNMATFEMTILPDKLGGEYQLSNGYGLDKADGYGDMRDGGQVQFKSVALRKYIVAEDGGGSVVNVNRDTASGWETFEIWRVSETKFQFRSFNGDFLSCVGSGSLVSAGAKSPSETEVFEIIRNGNGRVHIKLSNGPYVQATSSYQLRGDYPGVPGWDDNMATFEMTILPDNGHGSNKAKEILTEHRRTYVTEEDFVFMSQNGINTVRIPVGWWIAQDPNPPHPFVGGSLDALHNAFSWAQAHGIKCIIDLHAAPGSQNGKDHSASRDGSIDWTSPDQISQSLDVIEFLAQRYAPHPALLGIELLNEPWVPGVSMEVLVPYYARGYQIVRKYSPTAYVIVCQRIGSPDPMELFHANIGSSNLVLDLHWYSLYDASFDRKSVAENIQFIYETRRGQIQSSNSGNGPLVFIGEWVNEMAKQGGSQSDYQSFGKAQLDVYGEASFGWAYWSFKNVHNRWSLKWSIQNKYLLLGNTSSK